MPVAASSLRVYLSALAASVAMLCSSGAHAHTAWLRPVACEGGRAHCYQVVFGGHRGELEYPSTKVGTVSAFAADGSPLPVTRSERGGAVEVAVAAKPGLLLLYFDNGIYTRTADGRLLNQPMSDVENAVSATKAPKYHKFIAVWSDSAAVPQGQPFEVVPVDATPPPAGVPMQVTVLINGEPASGIGVGTSETAIESTSNAKGIATFTPVAGENRLWAGQRTDYTDQPDFTQLSIEYLMTFEAR